MIFVEDLLNFFKKKNINFFSGVPDSVLKNISPHLEKLKKDEHFIATNEKLTHMKRHYISSCEYSIGIRLQKIRSRKLPLCRSNKFYDAKMMSQ